MVWQLLLLSTALAASFTLSNTLGDSMVLQRAPYGAVVWGFANPGVVVTTNFRSQVYMNTTDASGVWRQALPPQQASGPFLISFTSSDGGSAALNDVYFGDVYLCGGQSNMQFTVSLGNNASNEIANANNYPLIRVFTVGQGTSSNTPLTQLGSIEQFWSVATSSSIGGADWAYQSAVCWLFGRQIFDTLGGKVPIGLISNNWGGTTIQQWSSAEAFTACQQTGSGNLWNAMIVPYTVGPMAIKGATWYQGESNVGQETYYACQFPVMINDWRVKLQNPNLWFGFIQIAGYNYGPGPQPADLRQAQLSALTLGGVGWATAVDVGVATDIHPTDKQTVASRLANSALEMIYGVSNAWHPPVYQSAQVNVTGSTTNVIVTFLPGTVGDGLTTTVPPPALAVSANLCTPPLTDDECGYPTIDFSDGTSVRATASLTADKQNVVLSVPTPSSGAKPVATGYGRASWPVTVFFNSYGLPVIPWYYKL